MVDNIQKNVLDEIRALYEEDEVAQRFFDWVSERKNDSAETSLDRIASRLNLHRSEAVALAKQLDHTKCARFILGRKGAKSRVQWAYSLRSLGMAAKGDVDQLDDVDPDIAAETAEQILAFTAGLSTEQIGKAPTPRKWSIREIVAHLADCEIVFSFRLRQTLAPALDQPHSIIQPFDQDAWAQRYGAYEFEPALALFGTARSWNLLYLTTVSDSDRHRLTTHPERGTMPFWTSTEPTAK